MRPGEKHEARVRLSSSIFLGRDQQVLCVNMSRVVLIAVDNSPQADAAFTWYLNNMHQKQHLIIMVHSMEVSTTNSDGEVTSEAILTQMWHERRGQIKALEEQFQWKLNEKGLTGKFRTESGKPGEVIIKVATEEKPSLIVLGCRGLSKLKCTLQGSVSDYVLHHAHCAVCICRQFLSEDDSS